MKTVGTTIPAIRFENGHILIGINAEGYEGSEFHVRIGNRIAIYTETEMEEIYDYKMGQVW